MMILFVYGVLFIFWALHRKAVIINTDYDTIEFKVVDYTYITRCGKVPTGLLLRSQESNDFQKYHIATRKKDSIPTLGSVIKVYVPSNAYCSHYADRVFFSKVLGYEEIK